MRNSELIEAPRQDGVATKVRAQERPPDAWTIRVAFRPSGMLDARTTHRKANGKPITPRERLMLQIIEGYARSKCYAWMSTGELAAAYGVDERSAQVILKEMDDDQLIRRVIEDADMPKRPGMRYASRVGVILLKRFDPDLPVATPA